MTTLEKLKELQLEIDLDKGRKSKGESVAKDEWYAPMSELVAADYLIDTLLPRLIAALEWVEKEKTRQGGMREDYNMAYLLGRSDFAKELQTRLEGNKQGE